MALRSKIWTRCLCSLLVAYFLAVGITWNLPSVMCESADVVPPRAGKESTFDLDPKGNCSEEIMKFCSRKSETSLECISRELRREQAGTLPEDGTGVSDDCKQEWRNLMVVLYKDVSQSKNIVDACKNDIEKICNEALPEGGVLACLRKSKEDLSSQCQDVVFVAEEDAANDFKMDPILGEMCSKDAAQFCKGISSERGLVQACLRNQSVNISYHCQVELFRQETEDAGDLRLNIQLFKACLNDKNKFCPSVRPGNSRVKDCLESNRLEPDFSSSCKEEFDKMLARRSVDFRLNPRLREKCSADMIRICAADLEDVTSKPNEEPRIIHCLQDYKDELKDADCKKEVHHLLALEAEDYRFDKEFSESCEGSRQKLCKDVDNDKVLPCLQQKREELDDVCRSAVFKMEMLLSGDIDYKFAMKQACGLEIGRFCQRLPHDQGQIIECLQQKVDDPDMGSECKKEIIADQEESARDFRLNYLIRKNCKWDVESFCSVEKLCKTSVPCGGVILKCLQDNINSLKSEDCKKDVFNFEVKEAKNIRLNIPLQTACHDELQRLCSRVSKDHSKSLGCLRRNRNNLTEECKEEELRFSMMEVSDIRLTPSLMNACGTELVVLCPDVSPRNGEAFKCLQLNLENVNMGPACKGEVNLQEARQASDYRLDVRVRTECKEDVDKFCGDVDKNAVGHATVLKCFVRQYRNLSGGCQTEVAYAVRMALWQYRLGSNLTFPCDEVVKSSCNASEVIPVEEIVIGTYGQCLTTQRRGRANRLNPECRALVRVATTNGFYIGNSTDADILAALKKYNELKGGDDFSRSGVGFFWVTTVVAFVALLAVVLFRRYSGPPKTYTLVVKGGDL